MRLPRLSRLIRLLVVVLVCVEVVEVLGQLVIPLTHRAVWTDHAEHVRHVNLPSKEAVLAHSTPPSECSFPSSLNISSTVTSFSYPALPADFPINLSALSSNNSTLHPVPLISYYSSVAPHNHHHILSG